MIENFKPQGFINRHGLCEQPAGGDYLFCYSENNLLLTKEGQLPQWKQLKSLIGNDKVDLYHFGDYQGQACLLLSAPPQEGGVMDDFLFRNVRLCHETLSWPLFRIAGLGRQLHYWRSTHRYCGCCGTETVDKSDERAKYCPECHYLSYPQLYPCVIVLVARGPELLLARSPHFQPGIYSALAGFIEPGESAENAVFREVKEEVKITVKNVRYCFSQPWPFPNSLMLGFRAEYGSGELEIDRVELEDAQWFKRDKLPPLPMRLGISRRLIEAYLEEE